MVRVSTRSDVWACYACYFAILLFVNFKINLDTVFETNSLFESDHVYPSHSQLFRHNKNLDGDLFLSNSFTGNNNCDL